MIISRTKNQQSPETIRRITEHCFAPRTMTAYTELGEGYFNAAYLVALSDGTEVVLKVAPKADVRVMTYEKNIMHSEVSAMRLAKQDPDIPVPAILGWDDSCTLCDAPYFFMEKLPGQSLNAIKSTLSAEQIRNIYIDSGRINRRINEIACPCFGYPGQPAYQGDRWFPVFRKMMETGIADAKAGNVPLTVDPEELLRALDADAALFDAVTEPKLVHLDLWDGNIFVQDGSITGLIDWERCIWGDPLLEAGFRMYGLNPDFLSGYGITMTAQEERRALWYDVYQTLLMSLECGYRQYETMDFYNWSSGLLEKQFEKLL